MYRAVGALTLALASGVIHAADITVRTESYPRPPYSGATYYIYERDGQTICTKLQVCNKYEQCDTQYVEGGYKDEWDAQTGDPYGKTAPVVIGRNKLAKHVCLTRFKLAN